MDLEWSANKSRGNRKKHGVSLEEAAQVFGGYLFEYGA